MVKKFRTMESVITRWVDCASVTLSLFKLFLSGEGKEIRAVPVVQFNRYCIPWLMVLKWTRRTLTRYFQDGERPFVLNSNCISVLDAKINNKLLDSFKVYTYNPRDKLPSVKKMTRGTNHLSSPKRRKITCRTIDLRTKDDIFGDRE